MTQAPSLPPLRTPARRGPDWLVIGITLALHGVIGWALLQTSVVRERLAEAAPLFVSLISAPAPQPPSPMAEPVQRTAAPPTPKPVPRPLVQQALQPTAEPTPTAISAPLPEPAIPAAAEAAPVEAAPPAPPPVIPPNFVAAYLDNPPPLYSALSKKLGEHGRVQLRVLVSTGGSAQEVQLQRSSGYTRLDEAAMEAVRRWRFVPARQGSEAVSAWVLVPIVFELKN